MDAASLAQRFWDAGVQISYSVALTMGATKVVVRYPDNRNPALGRYAVYQPCRYDKTREASKLDFEDPKAVMRSCSPEWHVYGYEAHHPCASNVSADCYLKFLSCKTTGENK